MRMRTLIITILTLLVMSNADLAHALDPQCQQWFNNKKFKTSDKDCLIKCSSSMTDMGTFHCPDQCDDLCKPKSNNCESAEKFWASKLKSGKPAGWPEKEDKAKTWSKSEKEMLFRVLEKLPRQLWLKSIESIYRFEKPKYAENLGSAAKKIIVLYDPAFASEESLIKVLVHEFAHQYYWTLNRDTRKGYWLATRWNVIDEDREEWFARKDNFVEEDGRNSPMEDFANNLEYYVLSPEVLKATTAFAHTWFSQRFGDSLKLGVGCDSTK